ncbi:MAG: glycosyltransferase, partial [Ruegeria sp.]
MAHPRITILLCTRDGADHLEAQLASYLAQDHDAWDLWVSDDGSRDDTVAILDRFAAAQAGRHHVHRIAGPRRGLAANYLAALCHPDFPAGPVALSDQDDVWHAGKLGRALARLDGATGPALYGAQYTYADAALRPLGDSRAPARPPGFGNALVQNIVSGHTATLNADALALVRQAGVPEGVPYHDWWLYQLVTGAGGRVIVDDRPVLLYRQHGANAMGGHRGLRASLRRLGQLMGRTYGQWMA